MKLDSLWAKARNGIITGSLVFMLSGCLTPESDPESSGFVPDSGNTNAAPTISGSPATAVTIGQPYEFTPTAADPDNDSLTFSVENLPDWTTFDVATGQISGTPDLSSLGTYGDIRITVSDGSLQTSLARFSIDVIASATGSATLSWQPPTQNEDGSPLTDLAGYNIYYGTSPNNYTVVIAVENPGITTYVVENLAPNTYYFVTTSVKSNGWESNYSSVGSKTIR